MERTLVLVKPDALQRGLAGAILARLERRGLKIVALRLTRLDEALARRLYAEHEGKPFLDSLVRFITSGPLAAAVLEGPSAVAVVRSLMGATDPQEAEPGTIRGDFGLAIQSNLIHGSDSRGAAEREIALFFDEGDLLSWERDADRWLFE